MQAVCTCFLHEIPYTRDVNRMDSNLVPNVRSGLYKLLVQKIHHEFISFARRQWFFYWNSEFFDFWESGNNSEIIKTLEAEKFNVYSIDINQREFHEAFNLHHNKPDSLSGSDFFSRKSANTTPIEIWLSIRSIVPFIDIIADKWQMQTSLTVTITGQPLSSNNMARQQIEFPISSIGKVLPFHHTRSQLSP